MALLEFTDEFNEVLDRWDGSIGAPSQENRKKDRIRVYKNGFVENVLASSHPILPGVWFGGFIIYGAYLAAFGARSLSVGIPVYLAGIVGFTLLEYTLHRWPFHFKHGPSRSSKVRQFLMHGLHHEFPNDKLRLVAPPLMSWPIAAVLFALYWAFLPHDLAWILFGGTTCGYLMYDWIHYYTHHFRSPKTRLGKVIRRSHAVHHYKLFHLNMGISSPVWDYLFGTYAWSDETVKSAMAETRAVEAQADEAAGRRAA